MSLRTQTIISALVTLGVMAALIHLPTGRWDWHAGWACWLANLTITVVGSIVLYARNPELIRRRAQIGQGTQSWDLGMVLALVLTMGMQFVVAGLDLGRSNQSPGPLMFWAGLGLTAAGFVAMLWCMLVNTHFEATVRLQEDRQHRLVDSGPYALVRHPGYASGLAYLAGLGLMLGSWWALCLWPIEVSILAARLLLEEEFLTKALAGYADYRQRVGYRLLPGLW